MEGVPYSKLSGSGCVEFATNYCLDVTVAVPEATRRRMVDLAMGITPELLESVFGGYAASGHWGSEILYRGPASTLFYLDDRWVLGVNGAVVQNLVTDTGVPLVLLRSGVTPAFAAPPGVQEAGLWEVRVITGDGRADWLGIPHPISAVACPAEAPETIGEPVFPPPSLFIGAEPGTCAKRGLERRQPGGAESGWPFGRFARRKRVKEEFGVCPSLKKATSCPSISDTLELPSCGANTLEDGELCLAGETCSGPSRSCSGGDVSEVTACVQGGDSCCANAPGDGCLVGCCRASSSDVTKTRVAFALAGLIGAVLLVAAARKKA